MNDSAIACDKIIEETKTVPTNFKQPVKHKISVFYLELLFSKALFISVSIYCYLTKYSTKQKHLLTIYVTNSELKEIMH